MAEALITLNSEAPEGPVRVAVGHVDNTFDAGDEFRTDDQGFIDYAQNVDFLDVEVQEDAEEGVREDEPEEQEHVSLGGASIFDDDGETD